MSKEKSTYTPTSFELWAASKIIGRECAATSKAYLECKQQTRDDLGKCIKFGETNYTCGVNIIQTAKAKFPTEFSNHMKCLDEHDYRFYECRETEKSFLDAWNKFRGNNVANPNKY